MAQAPSSSSSMDDLFLAEPPALDPVWRQHEKDLNLPTPRPVLPAIERQPIYVVECRELCARMTAPGARDHALGCGIAVRPLSAPSSLDGYAVPLLAYELEEDDAGAAAGAAQDGKDPDYVVFYIHGGGLHIGEADSEELSCRRILKEAVLPPTTTTATTTTATTATAARLVVYSVGYRLMPQHPASTCVADCIDAYRHVCALHPAARVLVVGSSSGGELAAFVAQHAAAAAAAAAEAAEAPAAPEDKSPSQLQGVVLRCPVTSDAFSGPEYVPAAVRALHTSAANPAFVTTLLGRMNRLVPRDGLPYMPLEAPRAVLAAQPRHWIQVCTNDSLYSDGVCYAKLLRDAGVPVQVDVVVGWPHTFWLKTPWMDRALEADRAMLRGLAWAAGAP